MWYLTNCTRLCRLYVVKFRTCKSRLLVKSSHIFSNVNAHRNAAISAPFVSFSRTCTRSSKRETNARCPLYKKSQEEGSGAKHVRTRRVSFDCASTDGIALSRHSGGFCRRHNSDDSHAAHGFSIDDDLSCSAARSRAYLHVDVCKTVCLHDRVYFPRRS